MSDTDVSPDVPKPVMATLLASGFPFQTAVARLARSVPDCDILRQEFPWRDDGGDSEFLALALRIRPNRVICVECKKTQKETYTFLQPGNVDVDVTRLRCLHLQQIQDSTRRMELFCSEWFTAPKSAEASFCVVSTSDTGRDSRLLERDGQLLISGTDAFAREYKRTFRERDPQFDRLIIPVIVTNARLFVAAYDPQEVSLETGQLDPTRTRIEPVDWVRFRKAFTSDRSKDLGDRTIVVVSATAWTKWLQRVELAAPNPAEDGKAQVQ